MPRVPVYEKQSTQGGLPVPTVSGGGAVIAGVGNDIAGASQGLARVMSRQAAILHRRATDAAKQNARGTFQSAMTDLLYGTTAEDGSRVGGAFSKKGALGLTVDGEYFPQIERIAQDIAATLPDLAREEFSQELIPTLEDIRQRLRQHEFAQTEVVEKDAFDVDQQSKIEFLLADPEANWGTATGGIRSSARSFFALRGNPEGGDAFADKVISKTAVDIATSMLADGRSQEAVDFYEKHLDEIKAGTPGLTSLKANITAAKQNIASTKKARELTDGLDYRYTADDRAKAYEGLENIDDPDLLKDVKTKLDIHFDELENQLKKRRQEVMRSGYAKIDATGGFDGAAGTVLDFDLLTGEQVGELHRYASWSRDKRDAEASDDVIGYVLYNEDGKRRTDEELADLSIETFRGRLSRADLVAVSNEIEAARKRVESRETGAIPTQDIEAVIDSWLFSRPEFFSDQKGVTPAGKAAGATLTLKLREAARQYRRDHGKDMPMDLLRQELGRNAIVLSVDGKPAILPQVQPGAKKVAFSASFLKEHPLVDKAVRGHLGQIAQARGKVVDHGDVLDTLNAWAANPKANPILDAAIQLAMEDELQVDSTDPEQFRPTEIPAEVRSKIAAAYPNASEDEIQRIYAEGVRRGAR